jgi:hypothetical protein
MTTTSVKLSTIPQGWFMSWHMSTQSLAKVCVTLADSATTYVDNVCRQNNAYGLLSDSYQQVAGTGLLLTITESANENPLKTLVNSYSVSLPDGTIVGQGYNILLEDWTDNDYNDLFVSLIAWQANG